MDAMSNATTPRTVCATCHGTGYEVDVQEGIDGDPPIVQKMNCPDCTMSECDYCGEEFSPEFDEQDFCSAYCHDRWWKTQTRIP